MRLWIFKTTCAHFQRRNIDYTYPHPPHPHQYPHLQHPPNHELTNTLTHIPANIPVHVEIM